MKNSKNKKLFTYMVVGALVMALSISCKSNEEPEVNRLHSNHPPAGTYKEGVNDATTATVTITGGGCNFKGKALGVNSDNKNQQLDYEITITKWYSGDGSTDKGNFGLGYQWETTIISPKDCTSFSVYYSGNTIIINFVDNNNKVYGVILDKQS